MRRTTENAWYFFYAMLFVFLLAILAVEAWGQEPKPPTPEQQIEQLSKNLLDWKFKYGAETQLSARLQVRLMQMEKQIKGLQDALGECRAEKAEKAEKDAESKE